MTLDLSTDHGAYFALDYRDSDDGPAGAVLAVFRDGGSLAGWVCAMDGGFAAVDTGLEVIGDRDSAEAAAAVVADADGCDPDAPCSWEIACDAHH